jgi:hypothetical protein
MPQCTLTQHNNKNGDNKARGKAQVVEHLPTKHEFKSQYCKKIKRNKKRKERKKWVTLLWQYVFIESNMPRISFQHEGLIKTISEIILYSYFSYQDFEI